jgi:hypothetical protein
MTTTDTVDTLTGVTSQNVSKALSGLTQNRTYYYRYRGVNAVGSTSGATEMLFTTLAVGTNMTATTNAATSITPTSAKFNGTINADNALTTVRFVWGTTTNTYTDSATAAESPVSGITNTVVSYTKTGLSSSTTYYFRVRGYNAAASRQGTELSFSTGVSVSAPTVVTQAATSVTQTTATLHGTVNPGNGSTIARFVWGTSTNTYTDSAVVEQGTLGGSTVQSVTKALTGLSSGTTYYFRLRAYNSAGNVAGSELTFGTTATTQAPTVTVTSATLVTLTSATLNGMVNAGNLSTTVRFLWGVRPGIYLDSAVAVGSPATGTGNTSVSHQLSNLLSGGHYVYTIRAYNTDGSIQGDELSFVVESITPPSITADSTYGIGSFYATLKAVLNPNNSPTSLSVVLFTGSVEPSPYLIIPDYTGDTTYQIEFDTRDWFELAMGTAYNWYMKASNSGGTVYSDTLSFTTLSEPPIIVSQSATIITADSVRLSCTYYGNGDTTNARFYVGDTTGVYTDTLLAGQQPQALQTTATVTVGGLTLGRTYYVKAIITNSSGTVSGQEFTFQTLLPLGRFVIIRGQE